MTILKIHCLNQYTIKSEKTNISFGGNKNGEIINQKMERLSMWKMEYLL